MAIITGTGTLTNNSTSITSITGLNQAMIGTVKAGHWLKIDTEANIYDIVLDATTETGLTLKQPYGGTSGAKTFELYTSFLSYDIPLLDPNMTGSFYVLNEINRKLINQLIAAGAPDEHSFVLSRHWIGEPIDSVEWGYFKTNSNIQIDKIRIYTDNGIIDGSLVLDFSIDDVDQALALNLTSGNAVAESGDLTTLLNSGSYIKFKWNSVVLPAGSNYFVDIIYHSVSSYLIRYDFNKTVLGVLSAGQEIAKYFKFPVKSKVFAVTITMDDFTGEGGDTVLELYLDNASLATPVIITIPEGTQNHYEGITQTDYETTEYCSVMVNGTATIPPQNIHIILHSYRIE